MAGNVYNQYVWLLETIASHDGITLSEICEAWLHSRLNECRMPLARRTFYNHIAKIAEIFNIEIECTAGYKYRIRWSGDINIRNMHESLLSHLRLSNALFSNPRMAERISLDGYMSFRYYAPLINSMEGDTLATILFRDRAAEQTHIISIAPYYIKQFENEWFVVGKEQQSREIYAYSFNDILAVRESFDSFVIDPDFVIGDFMRNPQFGTTQPNSNARYMELHNYSIGTPRRSRWGSYMPEDYNPFTDESPTL